MNAVELIDRIQTVSPNRWNRLFGDSPLTSQAFLAAFESSQSVHPDNGWHPQHLLLQSANGTSEAALPLYCKHHSYGEYVFDWSWANASQQAGMSYYPKLLTALPFTPSVGTRLGLTDSSDTVPQQQLRQQLMQQLLEQAQRQQASSWHLLFADDDCRQRIQRAWPSDASALLERHDCQFHWFNRNYRDFDHFLDRFSSRKRKSIRRERRRVAEQGIELQRLSGDRLELESLRQFYHFYQHTYHQRGQQPYLNWHFFEQIHSQLRQQMLLVLAERDQQPVGAALFLFDQQSLYGRWWGGLPELDCLHFEACYYQGIEFAIEQKLHRFDPGTQGEHKLLRGFEPIRTTSLHWIAQPALRQAIDRALQHERQQIARYMEQAHQHLPFKNNE